MRIAIWASALGGDPTAGPYKLLDILETEKTYKPNDLTHYGVVLRMVPPISPFTDEADQVVIVKLDPMSLTRRPAESVYPSPPAIHQKIGFIPILCDHFASDDPPPDTFQSLLSSENLSIEDVSHLITPDIFVLWKRDCFLSRDTSEALEHVGFALVHRYKTTTEHDEVLDRRSSELLNLAFHCLALIRPTRRGCARHVHGTIHSDGSLEVLGFDATQEPAEVPEVQKLFTIRKRDVDQLTSLLPEFLQLYEKDSDGRVIDNYEPLRMAVQLYSEAYAISYWKARHILWWSAIEALYGNNEDAVMARIYALFGNKNLADGYRSLIYDDGDIPWYYHPEPEALKTLGETVPLIYDVRNASAHGQKVPDPHFKRVSHPLGEAVAVDTLAEAATFVIRKTIIRILLSGWRENFADRAAREDFWLHEYGLDNKQSKKRLAAFKADLKQGVAIGSVRR